jgi:glycosidase
MYYAIRDVVMKGGEAKKLGEVLEHDALYPDAKDLITFIGNHDKNRVMGEAGATVQKLNAAASLLLTLRGIPQIYSGDEIAMPGGDDPDNRRDFPGGFPGDPKNAFEESGRTPEQQEAFAHLKKLLELHRQHKALQGGEETDLLATAGNFAYLRSNGTDRLLMVLNSTSQPQSVSIPTDATPLADVHALTPLDHASQAETASGSINVKVDPMTVAIYQVH